MIAEDFNRDPSTITSTADRELANRIRVVFPTSAGNLKDFTEMVSIKKLENGNF